jgi:signal transduction histidine kinase/CheY-like chemotaxis protein
MNSAAARLLGYEAAELIDAGLHNVIHPNGTAIVPGECPICQDLEIARTRPPGEPGRWTHGLFLSGDGRTIPVFYASTQIITDAGAPGVVMTFHDDPQFLLLENELRKRTVELGESESRKIEFIATLAHELRNPLAPIRTALELMRNAGDNAASTRRMREVMERQLAHMIRLIDDLLDISRLTTCQMTLIKERTALEDIIRTAMEATAPQIASKNIALTGELPAKSGFLQADATRLAQVFTNILNNASQFSPVGGPISVRVKLDLATVEIDIADSGVGIAGEALNGIFEMFTRVGRDQHRQHGGLGIGLHLARRLVELHDGRLVAASEGLGNGSHLLVTLPLAEFHDEEPMSKDLQTPAAAPGAARVLLVDDNVDAAVSLSLLLQLGGHTTQVVHSGSEALQRVAEFKPDVVLLDLGLPGMHGYEVARAIRAAPQFGRPLLVAITGWGAPEDRLKSKQAGLDEHLTKPVDISALELMLRGLPARQDAG